MAAYMLHFSPGGQFCVQVSHRHCAWTGQSSGGNVVVLVEVWSEVDVEPGLEVLEVPLEVVADVDALVSPVVGAAPDSAGSAVVSLELLPSVFV